MSMLSSKFRQGNQLLRNKNLEKAIAAYYEAIAENPNFHLAYHNLGEVLEQLGRLEEAVDAYQQAINLNPEAVYSRLSLSQILQKQNEEAEKESKLVMEEMEVESKLTSSSQNGQTNTKDYVLDINNELCFHQNKGNKIFSICIPFYQGFETFDRCINSILDQVSNSGSSKILRHHLDIVVTNDNLTIETKKFLEERSHLYNFRLIHNEKRLGLTKNWQKALSCGDGDIITLLHEDDWYNDDCLIDIFNSFQTNPDLILIATNAYVYSKDKNTTKQPFLHRKNWNKNKILDSKSFVEHLLKPEVPSPSQTFFRNKYLKLLDIYYDPQFFWCPEFDLYIRLASKFKNGKFLLDSRPLVSRSSGDFQYSRQTGHLRIKDYINILENKNIKNEDGLPREKLLEFTFKQINSEIFSVFTRSTTNMRYSLMCLSKIFSNPDLYKIIEKDSNNQEKFINCISSAIKSKKEFPIAEFLSGMELYRNLSAGYATKLRRTIDRTIIQNILPQKANHLDHIFYKQRNSIIESEHFNQPIIICGFHHSGTRLLAELLEAIGVFQVTDSPTKEWSFFQWLNMGVLPEWNDPQIIMEFSPDQALIPLNKSDIAFRLAIAGYLGHSPWGQKDPRNSITLSAWLDLFPKAKIVNIVRDPLDVLGTLSKNYSKYSPKGKLPQEEYEFWIECLNAYNKKIHQDMERAYYSVEVKFEDICRQPLDMLEYIVNKIKLDCRPEKKDIENLAISTDKIGIHKKWIADGRLTEDATRAIRNQVFFQR